jgi:hypothetical protein
MFVVLSVLSKTSRPVVLLSASLSESRCAAPRFRNTGQGDAGGLGTVLQGAVGEGHHPHEALVAVDHGKAAKLDVAHVLNDMFDVFILEAVFHVRGHGLADSRAAAFAPGDRADGDVAISDCADQAVAVADR